MTSFLLSGILLGLAAGFAPGPLLILVVSETLRHGLRAGLRVAVVPIITDLPIIAVTLLLLSQIDQAHRVIGLISLVGAVFIFYLGLGYFKTKGIQVSLEKEIPKGMRKGVAANFLSPHPYLFWLGVGGPIVNRAMEHSFTAALSFLGLFYGFLVGSKMMGAVISAKSKSFLQGRIYVYSLRFLGFLLLLFSLVLVHEGINLLRACPP